METLDLRSHSFWHSSDTVVLANPRDLVAVDEAEVIRSWIPSQAELSGHMLFRTSGSTGKGKWVALSKRALLASAQAVNEFLGSTPSDRWLRALPLFHVGGMGIAARAFLVGCDVYDLDAKWDVRNFYSYLGDQKITLTSMVPSQLADLVALKLISPADLRAVLIGGGRLSDKTYQQAIELGWPIRETYGMSETSSQVATSESGRRDLKILPIWQVQSDDSGKLELSGPPLLTGYVDCENGQCFLEDLRDSGWLVTNDLGYVEGENLVVRGRVDRCVKVLGELINLADVEDCLLYTSPSPRD